MSLSTLRRALSIASCFFLIHPGRASARPEDAKVEGTWKWSFTDQNGTEHKRALKIRKEGGKLVGVVVGDADKETPMKEIKVDGNKIRVSYTAERDGQSFDVRCEGKIEGDSIEGTVEAGSRSFTWAPKREPEAGGGEGWISLIKGSSPADSGWKLRKAADDKHKDGWSLKDGVLSNTVTEAARSIDIVHEKSFKDFELHIEFRIPKGSNSGVYLRGCYEVQVEDTRDRKDLTDHICGAIYGLRAPSENAALPASEWQTFDIKLVENKATVVHNGKKVIDAFELKDKTGGALNIKHGDPGPIMLQGDHGSVEYRNIRIRPVSTKL